MGEFEAPCWREAEEALKDAQALPYHVTVMEGQGYGEGFATLHAALEYATRMVVAIEADDQRAEDCDGVTCEHDDGRSWSLVENNGIHRWEDSRS